MKMQAIPIQQSNTATTQQQQQQMQARGFPYNNNGAGVPSNTGSPYHEFEFLEQSSSPAPPQYNTAYTHVQADVKRGYPPVPVRTSPPENYASFVPVGKPDDYQPVRPRSSFKHGILAFFKNLFFDTEGELVEKSIVDEAKRQAEAEEAVEAEQTRLEKENRIEAWARIERLTTEATQLAAIQAEVAREEADAKQASERRAERSRQRENAREELTRYRSQRSYVRILQALSYSFSAYLLYKTVTAVAGTARCAQQTRSGSGAKVLVARNNNSAPPSPQGAQPPNTSPPVAASESSSRRCSWRM